MLLKLIATKKRKLNISAFAKTTTSTNQILKAALETSRAGILIVNQQGKPQIMTPKFKKLWNISDAMTTKPDQKMLLQHRVDQVEDPADYQDTVNHLHSNPHEVSEDVIKLKDGRTFDRYSSPIKDNAGKTQGRIWFFYDSTKTYQNQADLEQKLSQQREEISVTTNTLRQALNDQIKELTDDQRINTSLLKAVNGFTFSLNLDKKGVQINKDIDLPFQIGELEFQDIVHHYTGLEGLEFKNQSDLWLSISHEDDRQMVSKQFHDVLHSRSPGSEFEQRFLKKLPDGTEEVRWGNVKITPKFDDSGNMTAIKGLIIDVTERKLRRLEEQQKKEELEAMVAERTKEIAKTTAFVNSTNDMILSIKLDNKFSLDYANKTYLNQKKIKPEDVSSLTFKHICNVPTAREDIGNILKLAKAGKPFNPELRTWVEVNNEMRYVAFSFSPYSDNGKNTHVVIVARDITDQKIATDQMRNEARIRESFENYVDAIDELEVSDEPSKVLDGPLKAFADAVHQLNPLIKVKVYREKEQHTRKGLVPESILLPYKQFEHLKEPSSSFKTNLYQGLDMNNQSEQNAFFQARKLAQANLKGHGEFVLMPEPHEHPDLDLSRPQQAALIALPMKDDSILHVLLELDLIKATNAVHIDRTIRNLNADNAAYFLPFAKRLRKATNNLLKDIDPLTGLLNRATYGVKKAEIAKDGRLRSVSYIEFDLDKFKLVNDTLGHGAGDEVLKKAGEIIMATTKKGKELGKRLGRDKAVRLEGRVLVFRIGGEELRAVLLDATEEESLAFAELLREDLEAASMGNFRAIRDGSLLVNGELKPMKEGEVIDLHVTMSIGVAHSDKAPFHLEELAENGDLALYAAKGGETEGGKGTGRNQVVAFTEEMAEKKRIAEEEAASKEK
jgi:diguanylate cyclase (GGDEF)-like protein